MVSEIWHSFRRLPVWVQLWVSLILVPVNLMPLAFLEAPQGMLVATLSVGGMAPNLLIMLRDRGFSRAMALPHLVFWVPLVFVISGLLSGAESLPGTYRQLLMVLLAVDLVSLAFDFPDAWKWWKGDRGAA